MMRTPQVVRDRELPERVTIYEVGPRDGLQNEIGHRADGGEGRVCCAGSLATGLQIDRGRPASSTRSGCPQLADAEELLKAVDSATGPRTSGAGPQRAWPRPGAGRSACRHVAIFGSATETFAQRNLNSGLEEQFALFEPIVRRARDAGLDVRAYVSMCFGDPWEGAVPIEQVVSVGQRLLDLGCQPASPRRHDRGRHAGHVEAVLKAFAAADDDRRPAGVHFHDTYGQALANTLTALRLG